MKNIKYILIFLAGAWMITGCDQDNKAPQSGYVNTGVESDQDDIEQGNVAENDPVPSDEEIALKSNIAETKPSNWYIRLVAEDPARSMKSDSSKLGTLEVNDAVEGHTLKALAPFGGSYLTIIFADPDGVEPGEYKTNFHTYTENVEDRWRFTVKSDDPNAQIILTWRGLNILTPYVDAQNRTRYKEYRSLTNPLNKHMKLIDTSSGNEIAAIIEDEIQSYSFIMGGNERSFEWVVQEEEVALPLQVSKLSTLKAKALQMDAKAAQEIILQKQAGSFDLSSPPMIERELQP